MDYESPTSQPELELSKESLELLRIDLGDVLASNGIQTVNELGQKVYTYELPEELIRDSIDTKGQAAVIMPGESTITYTEPLLDGITGHPRGAEISMTISTYVPRLGGYMPDLKIDRMWVVEDDQDALVTGYVSTEFTVEGRRISPADLPQGLDVDPQALANDLNAMNHPLGPDDEEKLRNIAQYIAENSQRK